jgi:hypothetical protein
MKLKDLAVLENPPPVGGEGDAAEAVADWLREAKHPDIADAVMARRALGVDRYGTPLRLNNGRDIDADLAQELIDALLYAWIAYRQAMSEAVVRLPDGRFDVGRCSIATLRWRAFKRIRDDILFLEEVRREIAGYHSSSTGSTPP